MFAIMTVTCAWFDRCMFANMSVLYGAKQAAPKMEEKASQSLGLAFVGVRSYAQQRHPDYSISPTCIMESVLLDCAGR